MISYHSIVCKKWIGYLINVALVYTPPSNKRRTRITKNLINAPVFNRINAVSDNNSNGKKNCPHDYCIFTHPNELLHVILPFFSLPCDQN